MIKKLFNSFEKLYKSESTCVGRENKNLKKDHFCEPHFIKNAMNTQDDRWYKNTSEQDNLQFDDLIFNSALTTNNNNYFVKDKNLTRMSSGMQPDSDIKPAGISRKKILANIESRPYFMCSTLLKHDSGNSNLVQPKFYDSEEENYAKDEQEIELIDKDEDFFIEEESYEEEDESNSTYEIKKKMTNLNIDHKKTMDKLAKKRSSTCGIINKDKVSPPIFLDNSSNVLNYLYKDCSQINETSFKQIHNSLSNQLVPDYQDEDTWFCKTKLYDDHIDEIVDKWNQLDSEIWCKVICMERNRRVAKAYIRLPYLIVTGNKIGFDGYTIGLNGFDNPHRDQETKFIVKNLEKGIRIKIDEHGNLIMRKMCTCSVQIKDWLKQLTDGSGSLTDEIISLHGKLPFDKPVKVFDINRFYLNLKYELSKKEPNRRKLAKQCILTLSFGKNTYNLLNSPCWLMVINVVALRMIENMTRIPEPDYIESNDETSDETEKCKQQVGDEYYSEFGNKECGSHIYSSI